MQRLEGDSDRGLQLRWQSGQMHESVKLAPHGYVGSNPTLSTTLSVVIGTLSVPQIAL